jgi:hypothetical protein
MRRVLRAAAVFSLAAIAVPVGTASLAGAASSKDQAILKAGVIGAADVPATWQSAPQTDPGAKQYKGIAVCKQTAAAEPAARRGPRKLSPQFADPSTNGNTLAENVAILFKDAKSATRYLTTFQDSSTPKCLQAVLQHQVGSRGQVGTLSPLASLQGVGDQSLGFEVPVQTQSGTLIADLVAVRVGRVLLEFTFTNPGVQTTQGPQIVNAVVNRVAQAGG